MEKKLLKLVIALAVFLAMLAQSSEVKASHAMGADLTYECIGGNTYRIRVSFYRDCIGISAPGTVYVSIQSASCAQNLGVTCTRVPGTGQEVTPLCPTALSTCNGGVYTGIQEWVYQGVVTLPMQCTDWVFSYNLCCRNAAITNISNPSSNTFYIYATLNNTISPCNSSPTFSNKPVPFACLGQEFCFNHGASDPDGDSLVYSLITPFQNAGTTVNYNAGFNAYNPLTSSPPVTFNTATGDICMTPTNMEVTVMAVLVSEYRNGVLIGSVERDIQVTVLNCNNNLPSLSGINGTNNFDITVCAGQQICFNINSTDPDAGQSVTMNWDNSIAGATFTTTGGAQPVGTFCWTPSTSDISNNPYCFTVRVNDNACPMIGTQIYSYCVTVQGVEANAGPDQVTTCSGLASINATASGGTGNYTYLWSNGVTLPGQSVGIGTYIVTVNDGVCTDTDTVQVVSSFELTAAFSVSGNCSNTAIQFTDQSTITGGTITSWNWNFGGTGTASTQNPVHTFPAPGTYNVSLIITSSMGCADTIIQPVVIIAPPLAAFSSGTACAGGTITFTNNTTPAGSYNWQWNFGNGQTSTMPNPSVTYVNAGTYQVTLIAGDTTGCIDTVTQQVIVNPLPVPLFNVSAPLCQGSPVTFTNISQPGGGTITGYSWNFGNGQTSTLQNPSTVYPAAGNYNVSLTITNSFGCTATVIQNIAINPPPIVSAGSNQSICIGQTATLTASGGSSYVWAPGGQIVNPVTVTPNVTTTYTVIATDVSGCTASSSVVVTVNALPVIGVTPNLSICAGQSTVLTASGATSYTWSPTGNTTATITVNPNVSTTYAVTGTNINGCSSTSFVTVTVNPVPVVNLSNVFICQGGTVTMNAGNPGSTFLWSTGQTTQAITINNPGTYTVTVTNGNGCTAVGSAIASLSGTIVNTLQNSSFCAGGSIVLDAGNPGSTYVWSTGATTQTITVNNGGPYSVMVTDPNGCTGVLSTTVNVNPLPIANFIAPGVCIDQPVQFTDISSVTIGSIVSWFWNFGDGNVSQQQNPVHTYSSSGTFNVTLIVTTNNGCVDTLVSTITVFPLPQANFSYSFGCAFEPIQFDDMSNLQGGNIISWYWDFDDGTSSTQQNPLHSFPAAGTYNVTLTITTTGGCTATRTRIIHIYPIPTLSFATNGGGGCLGETMTITNGSTTGNGAINTWIWDFGDGTTSAAANPVHTYTIPGTYTVTLIAITSHGCSDTISHTFTLHGLPSVNAGANQNVCIGSPATLTATGGVSYLWSTGQTGQTIQVTPTTATTYYVTVTDSNGCVGSDSVIVYTQPYPVVTAGPDRNICVGETVTLSGNYTNNHSWQPGGQTTQSITVTPSVTTAYVYSYTSQYGCTARDTVVVTVNPLPVASAGPDQMICEGSTATLTATGGSTYYWSPPGAITQTIYVSPVVPTVYSVLVIDNNGCADYDTVSVGINPTPTANLAPAFLCQGSSITLNAGNPGSTYLWSPGGETTQIITVTDSGYYEVLITSPLGCIGVASVNVSMGGTSLVQSPVTVNICSGQVANLNANNPGATYLWSTGATSQVISVSAAGIYTVTITDVSGCSASFSSNVQVNPLPQVQFMSTPACYGEPTSFFNQSSISQGNIISWNWSFGDGTLSNLLNPVHQYPAAGNYTVILQATSGMGCSGSATQQITIDSKPVAGFTASTVCMGQSTLFQNISTVANGILNAWNWDFGDGSTSILQNPVHNYTAPGSYSVSLIVYTTSGCSDTITAIINVLDVPVASFTAQNVCAGTAVQFIDGSNVNNGFISDYLWNFGDGNTSTDANPSHVYASAGTYNVTLSVTTDVGCSAMSVQQVVVYPMPVANATSNDACEETAVQFNNSSYINGGSITNVYWNFGDGGFSNLNSPSHVFNNDGLYAVLLTVTSNMGCVDSFTLQTTIHPEPNAAFTANNDCVNSQIQLTDQSTITSGTINSWFWNFGDGTFSILQNPSHNYPNGGSYNVTLVATSNFGCKDTSNQIVNVFGMPVAAFSTSNVCSGETALFYNQSTIAGGGWLTCTWNFGDGGTSSLENPQHTYANPGTYTVTMITTTQWGCSDTVSGQITIYAPPVAAFTTYNTCDGSQVNFTDLSTSVDGIISQWSWSLGDGTNSNSANPFHTYSNPGTYQVSLTVTTIFGCSNTTSGTVSVYSVPVPVISAVSNCVYDPVTFNSITAAGDTSTYLYQWTFGDGYSSNLSDPVHTYNSPGTYTVTLIMTSINGCSDTASAVVNLSPAPVANFQAGNACANSLVSFTNQSTISSGSIVSYSWNFGDGTTSSSSVNPSHLYTTAGTYQVTMIAVSDNGCTDTTTQQLTIFPLPDPGITSNQTEGCGPLTVSFMDSSFISSGSIISWNWNLGNGQTSVNPNPIINYNHSGNYSVSLTVTSNMGCSQTVSQSNFITVYPGPVANFTPDPFQTTMQDPTINFNNLSQGGNMYSWLFGDGNSSTLFEPTHTYQDTGIYPVTLIVMNSYGCTDTVIRNIQLLPEFHIYIPNAFTPNADGTNDYFTVTGMGIKSATMLIFNRWGEKIYTTPNYTIGWNGTVQKNNTPAQQEVYVYHVEVLDETGKTHVLTGTVTLVR